MATKKARRRGAPKRVAERRASKARRQSAQFIEITCNKTAVARDHEIETITSLFALDANGDVWQHDFDHGVWIGLPMKRQPNVYPDANNDEDN